MSKENAKAFVQAVLNDEELREKTANMKPEEAVPLGKEMGFDFTLEEFTDVMNEDKELSPEELEAAAGGTNDRGLDVHRHSMEHGVAGNIERNAHLNSTLKAQYCNGNANGTRHQFVESIEDREQFFGAWTNTYYVLTCSLCGYKQSIHIKFGENGEIIYG